MRYGVCYSYLVCISFKFIVSPWFATVQFCFLNWPETLVDFVSNTIHFSAQRFVFLPLRTGSLSLFHFINSAYVNIVNELSVGFFLPTLFTFCSFSHSPIWIYIFRSQPVTQRSGSDECKMCSARCKLGMVTKFTQFIPYTFGANCVQTRTAQLSTHATHDHSIIRRGIVGRSPT